jgi:hypothetical protein
MKMQGPTLMSILFLMPLVFGKCNEEQLASCVVEPGFKVGYIDRATLELIMDKAQYLRVYGVKRNRRDEEGSVMAIGVDDQHAEIPSGGNERTYFLFDVLEDDRVRMQRIDQNNACTHMHHIMFSGKMSCTADLERALVEKMLENNAEALMIRPHRIDDSRLTISYVPVRFENGSPVEVGDIHVNPAPCPFQCDHYETFACIRQPAAR